VYAFPGHGKKANGKTFKKVISDELAPDQQANLDATHFELHFDETSLRLRRRQTRSKLMEQTEKLHIFLDSMVTLPDRKRQHYQGTNRGRSWGFLVMEPLESLWHVQWQMKQAAYGKEAIRPVGGKADEGDADMVDDTIEDRTIKATTMVPMVWHGLPRLFYTELLQVNNCVGIIDFTPGDGNMALAALHHSGSTGGVVYCGWCHTEQHAQLLREYLGQQVLKSMREEGNPLYDVQCAMAFMDEKASQQQPKPKPASPSKRGAPPGASKSAGTASEAKPPKKGRCQPAPAGEADEAKPGPLSSPPPSPSESL
jgi:hypothetical protein